MALTRARRTGRITLQLAEWFEREPVVLGVLLVLAIVTRFYGLGLESLWLDEATTYHRSLLPFDELVADAKVNHHNPAYFLLMSLWVRLGDSEAMLRAPSAFFGVLKVLAVYAMGRVVGGRWLAAASALVILLNPTSLAYDQEARMYAAYALGASVAMAGVLWLVAHEDAAAMPLWQLGKGADGFRRHALVAWLAFWLGTTLALYMQSTATVFMAVCSLVALAFIIARPAQRSAFVVNWVLANLAVVVAYAPWLVQLVEQAQGVANGEFWLGFPTRYTIARSLRLVYLFGKVPGFWLLIPLFCALGSYSLRTRPLLLVSLWLFTLLGPALLLLLSLREAIFMHRQFLWCASPLAVVAGAGLVARSPDRRRAAALATFLVLGAIGLRKLYYGRSQKPRWREALGIMTANVDPRDEVLTLGGREEPLLEYYFGRSSRRYPRFVYRELPRHFQSKLGSLLGGARAVWTIEGRPTPGASSVAKALAARAPRDYHRTFMAGLTVERYALTPGVEKVIEKPVKATARGSASPPLPRVVPARPSSD